MTKRIIEIGRDGCYLKLRHQQLVIEQGDEQLGSIPIEDMSALVIDHPQTVITQACLSALVEANVMVINSDQKHQPIGMLLPLQSNTLQTERFAAQATMSQPLKKNLWKQIVQAKVRLQGKILKDITGNDAGLAALMKKVRSGDPDNIEAQAARRYWGRLFSGGGFKRDRNADDQNRYLNYGYAILRALTSRSLCATGLHPTLGLHHRNRYNAYCLADDLMEPYRPYIDLKAWEISDALGPEREMDQACRGELLGIIQRSVSVGGELLTFQGAVQKSAQSLSAAIMGQGKQLALPDH